MDDEAQPAQQLGPYAVVGRIARGGMGDVLLGRDGEGREVALKVLRAPLGDDLGRKRFDREGYVLGTLQHEGLVRLLGRGVDEASGRPWLALELIRGRDLDALLDGRASRRLTADEVTFALARLADALAAAHDAGVVHRDVKPANVLLTPDRRVLLTDFGIALANDVSVRLTRDEILGTPAYLAPEVLLGGAWEPAADVYALGALAWRALVGRPLFEGASATDILAERLTSETPPLATAAPGTPEALCALVDRMLDKEPARRPAAREVARELAARAPAPDAPALSALWSEAAPAAAPAEAAAPLRRARVLAPGDTFLHYRVDAELGRGGMGVVYRAFHLGLGKPVALKVLLAGALATEVEQRRFLREAHAASVLSHPCVVPVLDAGEHEGTFYMVLELVEGQPLSRWLASGAHDRGALLRLFLRLCDGVQHAHTRGVIHRDLKPDNVLISSDDGPAPHILDFGLAKRLDQDEEEGGDTTREGNILGTLRYMAPEQASGKVDEIDVRSDVYALGTILYELLAGAPPFSGSTREVLSQILFAEPAPPGARAPGLPWELDAICLKALEKDREARYQSALELKSDVERFLADQPISARQATARYRLVKWLRRNRGPVAAAAAVAVVVVGLAAGWSRALGQERRLRTARTARVLEAASEGWRRLAADDPQGAAERFALARELVGPDDVLVLPPAAAALLPDEARAGLSGDDRERPRVTAARLAAWDAFARERVERAQLQRLLGEAESCRAAGRLAEAARALALAARLDADAPGVRSLAAALVEAHAAAARAALGRARADDDLAARRAHLEAARGEADEARRVDAAHPTTQDLLAQVHAELGKQAELEQARALRERQLAQAAALVEAAERAVGAGDLDAARRAYEQALGFDGSSDRAQDGLVQVFQRAEARDRDLADRERRTRLGELRERAAAALGEARERFARGELPAEVRDRYLAAMEALRQGLFLVPDDADARADLQRVAREFSVVLVDQGNPELAGFILRVGGVDAEQPGRAELPRDPYLAVVEADRVNVRQAFGGTINFLPTRAFERLRAYVRSQTDRHRFVVEVRSEVVTRGAHPQVYATGLRVRMEDRMAGTVSAPVEIPFQGGPFLRPVVVSPQGPRLVRPFDEAQGLDAPRYVRQVETAVQTMLQRAKR